jgi:myo-inositol-1(or 4)-monophosphatase
MKSEKVCVLVNSEYKTLLDIATGAIDVAVSVIKAAQPQALTIRFKAKKDIQTSVDCLVEESVKKRMAEATPDIPFWGEETGKNFDQVERFWVMDPIDGTENFIHGLPLYAVSLALIEDGEAVLGVIDAPAFRERFQAVKGEGAFCNGKRISVSDTSELQNAILCYGDPDVGPNAEENNQQYDSYLGRLMNSVMRTRLIGSAALQLAWLAAGRIDISVTWGNLPWDVQAGVLLVREAGGAVMDIDGLDHSFDSRYTIATNYALSEPMKHNRMSF